jgi:hypothetical protein
MTRAVLEEAIRAATLGCYIALDGFATRVSFLLIKSIIFGLTDCLPTRFLDKWGAIRMVTACSSHPGFARDARLAPH